ncbi:MAG: rRNA maturation RNase YbeY [Solirubrobacteraceae bacterium]
MIEVEVFGAGLAPQAPPLREMRRLCAITAARMGIERAHVAVEFVDSARIAELNGRYRGKPVPTDVLSFPIDGVEPAVPAVPGARGDGGRTALAQEVPHELGDVVICPQHTADVREAIVHGMLHLLGMDHETDDGEMLALQRELLAGADG